MSREIKFRAWDKRERHRYGPNVPQMRYDVQNTYDCEAGAYFGELVDDHDVILMQLTGLKDKNGVEIYEGDICEIANSFSHKAGIYPIEYEGACFLVGGAWLCGAINIEVIGNIHEHPELLITRE